MLDLLWEFDKAVDLSALHALASVAAAMLTLWLMVCRTREAGFRNRHALMLMTQRLAMAALAVALMASAATPFYNDSQPCAADVAVRVLFLCVLIVFSLRLRFDSARI